MNRGDRVGPYELVEADDEMGRSWRALSREGTVVQVDLWPAEPDEGAGLDVEIAVARQLRHPNLVRFVDAGILRDQRWVAVEFVEGLRLPWAIEGLRRRQVALPPGVVAYVMHGLARAIRYIHEFTGPDGQPLDAVGRPLLPASVILSRTGGVKLATLPRISPPPNVDGRSDLLGLANVGWSMISRRPDMGAVAPDALVELIERSVAQWAAGASAGLDNLTDELAEMFAELEPRPEDEVRRLVADARRSLAPPRRSTMLLEAPSSSTPSPEVEGVAFGTRFVVLERLGVGGMSEVYRVHDRELDEVVALKVLSRPGPVEERLLDRLRREVRLARRIASDYVCRIFDIVDFGQGVRGLTMALVEGVTLADLMAAADELEPARIAGWGADIAAGLAAAHELSIVHRDLKPHNVMIRHGDDRAIILDFGFATAVSEADARLTRSGLMVGTPLFMSPEQLRNGIIDARSDLYALGLILFRLVTGELPHASESQVELLKRRAMSEDRVDVRAYAGEVPDALAEVINALLRPLPADRPGSAAEVRDRLRAISSRLTSSGEGGGSIDEAEPPPPENPPPPPEPTVLVPPPRRHRGRRRAFIIAAVILLALDVALIWAIRNRSRPPATARDEPAAVGRTDDGRAMTPAPSPTPVEALEGTGPARKPVVSPPLDAGPPPSKGLRRSVGRLPEPEEM